MDSNIYYHIEELKDIWEYCVANDSEATPFQSYQWNYLLERKNYHFFNRLKNINRCCHVIQYHVFIDGNKKIIFPLLIDKKEKTIELLGNQDSSDYLNVIANDDCKPENIQNCIIFLRSSLKGFTFIFDRIPEGTRMEEALQLIGICDSITKPCVAIKLDDTCLQNLSKNTRQVLRTAQNRMEKNGLTCENVLFIGRLNPVLLEKTEAIYYKRSKYRGGKNNYKFSLPFALKSEIKKILFFPKDTLVEYLLLNDGFISYNNMGRDIGAFFLGIPFKDTIYVCRAAFNMDYGWYSPGDMNLFYALSQLKISNFTLFDLTRGIEQYKLRFGGVIRNNHLYSIESL
jgi:hypothetical protein